DRAHPNAASRRPARRPAAAAPARAVPGCGSGAGGRMMPGVAAVSGVVESGVAESGGAELDLRSCLGDPGIGEAIHELAREIFPIGRSITGPGVRQTLDILGRHVPLERREVPTGTAVFDWTIPREWVVRAAFIRDASGRTVVDLAANNLHLVGYSTPVRAVLPLAELKRHIHTLPEQPDLIPYR